MKNTGFEMPAEMKAMAEQGIETARQAFQGYLNATEKALGAFESTTGAQASAREVSRKAMGFAQENVIGQKLQVIQEIDAGRFIWAHILDEVSRALPPYVWVVNLTEAFSEGGVPRVRMEGRAGNYYALGRYILLYLDRKGTLSQFYAEMRAASAAAVFDEERASAAATGIIMYPACAIVE